MKKKEKIGTLISTVMMAVPWSILILRQNQWALESPTAEIMISCYAVFMILSGIFTALFYQKYKVTNPLMQICLVVNGLYTVAGIGAFVMMAITKFS